MQQYIEQILINFVLFQCFNLDICAIDLGRSWENYKRKIEHYMELFDQYRQNIGTFTCYIDYPESYKITPSALMELNTSFSDLFRWFILPILAVGICWIGIMFVCYWFGCPVQRRRNENMNIIQSTETEEQQQTLMTVTCHHHHRGRGNTSVRKQ